MSRIVVVTGGSAGIGRASARAFAERGADVALIARGGAGLAAAAQEIRATGRRALELQLDVADADAVEEAADQIERELGAIDVWVNNAMVSVFSPVLEMTAAEYRRVTEVTYLGTVHGTMAALRRMQRRDRGTIVQVGSALAYRSIPLQSAYCAAKHAVAGFTDSLRSELIHDGSRIRITQVNLPAVNTPQFDWVRSRLPRRGRPVPPIFQPEVAARAIVHAAEHPKRHLHVGRSSLLAIYGQNVAPGLLDQYLGRTGHDAQQAEEPEQAGRPDNLEMPVDATVDHGAEGRFSSVAAHTSPVLDLAIHAGAVRAALLVGGMLALGMRLFRAADHAPISR
ncbi:MAG TPA: SDR family oxidoreductase [Candidatus Limnocylindrales bacterium]|jgi:short-subunit dehydrogenase